MRVLNIYLLIALKFVALIFSISLLINCNESDLEMINKTINRLENIETVKYDSRSLNLYNGAVVNDDTVSAYFDMRKSKDADFKCHLSSKSYEYIFNGKESISIFNNEKVMIVDKNIDPYNAISSSLPTLKEILSKLIHDSAVKIVSKRDTIIGDREAVNYSFELKGKHINWQNRTFVKALDISQVQDANFDLVIDKKNYLPLILKTRSAQNVTSITSFENVNFNYEVNDDLWSKSRLSNDYAQYTMAEYIQRQQKKLKSFVGQKVDNWGLLGTTNQDAFNPDSLEGNIVLLEFWFKGCGACIAAVPKLNSIYKKYKNQNFKVLGIEYLEKHSIDVLRTYIKESDKSYPNLFEGKAFAAEYGVLGAPTIMILDKTGKILYLKSGLNESEIIAIIENNI